MEIKQCTKAQLLNIIDRLCFYDSANEYHVARALGEIEMERIEQQCEESDRLNQLSYSKRTEAAELLKPYEGRPIAEIPSNIVKKVLRLIDEAKEADYQCNKLNGIRIRRKKRDER